MERIACFVCGSQRTGSNVLCEALTLSGVAGRPTEHFVPSFEGDDAVGHVHAGFERSAWARGRGIETFPEFFDAVLCDGSTPNGVFSTKLMWNAFGALLEKLAELPDCRTLAPAARLHAAFLRPRFVFLRRRNRVRQAVSWALAAQTGHFSTAAAATRPPFATPAFDIDLLDGLHRLIREAEAGWSAFFERTGSEPLCLWYEDLAPDVDATLARVLAWLELPAPDVRVTGRLRHQPQATALNAEWEARYRALRPSALEPRHAMRSSSRSSRVAERASRAVLPDLLVPGLALVVCGTAAGTRSAAVGHYYAGPGNKFWATLAATGLTPRRLAPAEGALLPSFGIGLTDVVKAQSGGDADLVFRRSDRATLRDKIERFAPAILCFNGKRAGHAVLGRGAVRYGLQAERIAATRLFVAPSTSGAANGYWDVAVWHELARLVTSGR